MSSPGRVALVVPVPAPRRGPDDAASLLERTWPSVAHARALADLGVEVELFLAGPGYDDVVLAPGLALRLRPVPPSGLVDAAEARRPELLHLFHLRGLPALLRAAAGPTPCVAEYNGGVPPEGRVKRRLMRAASSRLCGVMFTARAQAEPFHRAGALDPCTPVLELPELSSRLVHPSRAEARAALGLVGAPVVVIVARVEAPKDPHCALRAFARIVERRPEARLEWAHRGGRDLDAVRARVAADPRLRGRVRLRADAPRDVIEQLWAAADLSIHASHREVCGTAFLEALGAGVPVAASDIPPFRAVATGPAGPEGVAFAPIGDDEALAAAGLRLLDDPGAGARARAHFERRLSFEALARRRLDAWASALDARRRP